MSQEVIIQKLGSVIAIEAEQGEGESFFDLFDPFQGLGFSFAPDGSLFSPAGSDVYTVNCVGEHPGEGFAVVGGGVSFEEAWSGFIPLVGFDRYLFS